MHYVVKFLDWQKMNPEDHVRMTFAEPTVLKEVVAKTLASNQYAEAEFESEKLDDLYLLLNADDRPNGHTQRSLSVGDVVVDSTGAQYACASAGWVRLN